MSQDYCIKCMRPVTEGSSCSCGFDKSKYFVDSYHLIPGSILRERYYVGTVLGEGGFGITYVGMDTLLQRKIAIKEYFLNGYANRTTVTSNEIITKPGEKHDTYLKYMEGFLNEGRTLARFADEKNIVSIYDYFKANNTAYIVMEFLEGETLSNYCKKNGFLKFEEMLPVFVPIMNVLGNIHKENVIHRDISPDNIIINTSGVPKLLDFGAARSFEKDEQRTMSIILKPGYAPMEQYTKKGKQGPWTDIYALCATMYYCMTGVVPGNAIERQAEDDIKSISDLISECPKNGGDAIMKGMAVKIEDRFQSIQDLKNALISRIDNVASQVNNNVTGNANNNINANNVNETGVYYSLNDYNNYNASPVNGYYQDYAQNPQPYGYYNNGYPNQYGYNYNDGYNNFGGQVYYEPPVYRDEEEDLQLLKLPEDDLPKQYVWEDITWNQSDNDYTNVYPVDLDSEIGEVVSFSWYKWIVLSKYDNRMVLITENCIATLPYHVAEGKIFKDITWEKSCIRKWLNTEFYNSFSDQEKAYIQLTAISNNINEKTKVDAGNDTVDRVFLLSEEEVKAYYRGKAKAKFDGREYAWWLRTPGATKQRAVVIRADGKPQDDGIFVDSDMGVRPVITLCF